MKNKKIEEIIVKSIVIFITIVVIIAIVNVLS